MFAVIFTVFILVLRSEVEGKSYLEQQGIVTTIKTNRGQVYDCIEFYKQPAFTNISFDTLTEVQRPHEDPILGEKLRGVFIHGDGCPTGTIPILRVNKNYSSFHGTRSKQMSHSSNTNDSPIPDTAVAIVRTKSGPNKRFLGAEGSPSTHKPSTYTPDQWSTARMKLLNGPDSIEAGWMVNPSLFKDNEAHLYVQFIAGQKGCINTQCPGFVQVGKDVPLGVVPDHYSQTGGQFYTWKFFIDKHEDDGNWWLSISDDKYGIGYWPKTLFTSLTDVANQVEWGGEVGIYSDDEMTFPMMGNGLRATYDTKYSSFYKHVTVVNEGHHNVNPEDTEKLENFEFEYNVLDAGYKGDYYGRLIFYGGPFRQ